MLKVSKNPHTNGTVRVVQQPRAYVLICEWLVSVPLFGNTGIGVEVNGQNVPRLLSLVNDVVEVDICCYCCS